MGPTNKNPEVIAKYYLDAVKQLGGVPRKMRSDDGTKNSVILQFRVPRSFYETAGYTC